ncbi:MAG: plasmid replication protein RepC [Beijerinckiaceae bacterium]
MQPITTPFGRRPLSLGHIAAQIHTDMALEEAAKPGSNHPAAVNKWTLFRTLTQIRERLGVSDRSLNLLNALLTFHPETALTLPKPSEGDADALSHDLVVFPSNKALALRASGMAEKTLRRHLTALVEAGLIIRRDSPNGKRYARKDVSGTERFSDVYGFDLTPLVARAPEFEMLAEETRRAARARAALKERITLRRRDAAKLIALGLDEALPGDWEALRQLFMTLVTPLRRILSDTELERTAATLATLCTEAETLLQVHLNTKDMTGNAGDFDRHQSNSNTNPYSDFEPASKEEGSEIPPEVFESGEASETKSVETVLPLGLVLEACPDVKEYAAGPVRTWPQFIAAARSIRPMLGISPDAWATACSAMGDQAASIVIAVILQRSEYSSEAKAGEGPDGRAAVTVNGSPAVLSPGGYLRALTEKATFGEFSPGPVLMALIGQRMKQKRAGV